MMAVTTKLMSRLVQIGAVAAMYGCATQSGAVRERFQREHNCGKADVYSLGASTYRVAGCGYQVTYVCTGGDVYGGWGQQTGITCIRESSSKAPAARGPMKPASKATASAPAREPKVVKRRLGSGKTLIKGSFEMPVGSRFGTVFLSGSPVNDQYEIWFGIRIIASAARAQKCEVRVVANGKRVEIPVADYKHSGGADEFRIRMQVASLAQIGGSRRVIGRICEDDFEMTEDMLATIRKFLVFFEEEVALTESSDDSDKNKPVPTAL
jgi:hypothetical protein